MAQRLPERAGRDGTRDPAGVARDDEVRLLADVGGTNARFALQKPNGTPASVRRVRTDDFKTLEDAIRDYVSRTSARPRRAAIAVASPVTGDRIEMTNHPWSFSVAALSGALGVAELRVVNDFEAVALSLPRLDPAELRRVGGDAPAPGAPRAVIGPGTGLGVAALVQGWAVPTEGGHVTMPACDAREAEILARIRARLGHVSAERVLSGMGLKNLYRALGRDCEPPEPDEISARALAGADPRAVDTLETFCAMLGTVAGNLALTLGARGGVYIAGGIVRRFAEFFARSGFRDRFEDKGRFREYLAPIPVWIIGTENPALLGLAALLDEGRLARHRDAAGRADRP
jgi:glucokinase